MSDEQAPVNTDTVVTPSDNQDGFPPAPDPGNGTFTQELEKIANETGNTIDDSGNAVPVNQTQTPPEPTAPPVVDPVVPQEVPDKFKDQDGNLDQGKVEKATFNAQEALDNYDGIVKDMHRKANEAHNLKLKETSGAQPTATPEPTEAQTLDSIGQQIEEELRVNGTGKGLARILNVVSENAYQRARSDLEGLNQKSEARERREQLTSIAENDKWVFTPEGRKAIQSELEANPWLRNSPQPITAAYHMYRGKHPLQSAQVWASNPQSPSAPVTPAGGARPVEGGKPSVNLDNEADRKKFLDSLTPEEEKAFWASQGVPNWVLK